MPDARESSTNDRVVTRRRRSRSIAMAEQVIVIGGGLAGLSAAHTVLEHGARVVLLDKCSFLGGNSTKATSGINGALTRTQARLNIPDSADKFEDDIIKGAAGVGHTEAPAHTIPLAKVLAQGSGSSVDWLCEKFKLDLSLVAQLGGHSYPRTHRGKERFPGFTITYALMEGLEKVMEDSNGETARIITKAEAKRLLTDGSGTVIGVEYEKDGVLNQEYGPVVIATGGFGADYKPDSLLKKYRPDLQALPTTNGDHCTGDGIKMAMAVGADTIDMTSVQVHPTGLVNPAEPDSKVKFLAAEALRGVGGILLDANGNRFADELGRRDYVSGEMNRNKGPFRLILNGKASTEIEWHCKHYVGRGIMKRHDSGAEVAKELGISPQKLADTFAKYNEAARTKNCPFGKKFFTNAPFEMNDFFHSAIVCTVVHYTMGGLAINTDSQIVGPRGPIPGLFGAGEVVGGIHGRNRLGGNSLLDCVVFGRVAGSAVSRHLMSTAIRALRSGQTTAMNRVANLNDKINPPAMSAAPAAASAASGGGSRALTMDEINKHNTEGDLWVIIEGNVYDLTKFLPDHPGGKKAIMLFAGKDATEEFNMLHPPNVLKKYLSPDAKIGTVLG
ncbi:cytochrome b5 [Ostreococcus tauri]|uniref:Cytochrome b5 n=2 Tax=Ostreococcus tauri TaxID=70448 RepID=A0A1Y5I9R9_OSTTA|nr:cytochrome b5 [Ostreococcus tauri]